LSEILSFRVMQAGDKAGAGYIAPLPFGVAWFSGAGFAPARNKRRRYP